MKLLLVSQVPTDRALFEDVAAKADLTFSQYINAAQAVDELQKEPSSLVVVDASSVPLYIAFETAVSEKLGLFSAAVNPNHYIFVASQPFHACNYLQTSQLLGSFVQRGIESISQVLAKVLSRFTAEKPFGLETYFDSSAKFQSVTLKNSKEKSAVVEAVQEFLERWGMNSRASVAISGAIDEMMMNAIFDAPADELGRPLYLTTPRSTLLALDGKNEVEVRFGHNEDVFAMSVIDQHGSIDRQKLMSSLAKNFQSEDFKIKASVAGAGLGLAHSFAHCAGSVFVCEPGVRSEVIFFYKRTNSFKEFRERGRFFGTFFSQA